MPLDGTFEYLGGAYLEAVLVELHAEQELLQVLALTGRAFRQQDAILQPERLERHAVVVARLTYAHGGQHAGVAQLTQHDGVVELARPLVHVRLDAANKERRRRKERLHQLLQRVLKQRAFPSASTASTET